jgi:hypothetical protein
MPRAWIAAHALDERNAIEVRHAEVYDRDVESLRAQKGPCGEPILGIHGMTIEAYQPGTHQAAENGIVVRNQNPERIACHILLICRHSVDQCPRLCRSWLRIATTQQRCDFLRRNWLAYEVTLNFRVAFRLDLGELLLGLHSLGR